MQVLVQLNEIDDVVNRGVELGLGETVINEGSADVLIPGKLGVETEPGIDQCLDGAVDGNRAAGRGKIACDQFEQCRLAGTVSADYAEPLAALDDQRYVFQSGFVVISRFSPEAQARQSKDVECLLGRAVVQSIDLGDAVEHDGRWRVRHSPRTRACHVGRGESRQRMHQRTAPSLSVRSSSAAGSLLPPGSGR